MATSTTLCVTIEDIPEEGLSLSGELDRSLFDLKDGLARAVSPLSYDLQVMLVSEAVILLGEIAASFELQCSCTLEYFSHEVRLAPYRESVELENPDFLDLTDRLREDILLALPAYPRSPAADGADAALPTTSKDDTGDEARGPSAWDALDGLKHHPH